jgi:F-type H+-transporting ATPase subunit b
MHRGWLFGWLIVAFAVAPPALVRADAPDQKVEKKADAKDDKALQEVRERVSKMSDDELKAALHEAIEKKRTREAAVILRALQVRHEKPEDLEKELSDEMGEPKKSVFGWSIDLAIWTAVVFLVMLLLLWKFAWGPMLQGLEAREKSIHSAVEDAKAAREEAQRLQAQMQAEMAKAGEQARALVEEATKRAAEKEAEMLAEAKATINAERERARRELDLARDQALQEISTRAADLSTAVSSKVLRRELNEDDHRRLIAEALDDLQRAAAERQAMFTGARA